MPETGPNSNQGTGGSSFESNKNHERFGFIQRNKAKIAIGALATFGLIQASNTLGSIVDRINIFDDVAEFFGDMPDVTSQESIIEVPEVTEIIEIESINFDCRSRVTAVAPIDGKKDHGFLGQVYRTDKVKISAVGDVDTCLEGGVNIFNSELGSRVIVDTSQIEFVRPRIIQGDVPGRDEVTTIEYDAGFIGDLSHILPFVSSSEGLTEAGLEMAQNVIGSSRCMESAYDQTIKAIEASYIEQGIEKGVDDVEVVFTGNPSFINDTNTEQSLSLDGFDFEVDEENIRCLVAETNITENSEVA